VRARLSKLFWHLPLYFEYQVIEGTSGINIPPYVNAPEVIDPT
jgi:hypothetical protein